MRRLHAIFGIAAAWIVLHGALAAGKQTAAPEALIPRSQLFADATRFGIALTGDGKRLATIALADGRRSISLATLGDGKSPQSLTLPAGHVPLGCQWAADDGRLFVTCRRAGAARVLVYTRGGDSRGELAADIAGSLQIARLSAAEPRKVLLAVRDKKNALAYWLAEVDGNANTHLLDAADVDRVYFDANWKPRAAERSLDDGTTELLGREGDTWTRLHLMPQDLTNTRRLPRAGVAGVVGLDAPGSELLIVDNADDDRSRLVALNVDSGNKRVVAADADADLMPNTVVDRRSGNVLAASAWFGPLRRHLLDDSLAGDFRLLERHFAATAGFVNISGADAAWLVAPLDGGPLRFHVFDRQARTVVPVGSTHPELDGIAPARRTAHVVTARDGLRLPCHLYVAQRLDADGDGRPDAPCPALVYVHGGPSIPNPWDNWFANRCLQLLADRGYAVLNVDFRGAGGYGKGFVRRIWGNWGRATVNDFEDIAHWAVDEKIALPEKIGIWGWSYGGLATFSALAFSPDTFACGISMYGLSDMEAFARYAALGPHRQQVYERIGNPTTAEGAAALRAQSPLYAVENVKRPLLVTHGAKDLVAPRMHSDKFVEALQQHGQQPIYLLYPTEGHDYRDARSWISFWAVAERFLHEHLGGRYEPAGDDLVNPPFEVLAGGELIPELSKVSP